MFESYPKGFRDIFNKWIELSKFKADTLRHVFPNKIYLLDAELDRRLIDIDIVNLVCEFKYNPRYDRFRFHINSGSRCHLILRKIDLNIPYALICILSCNMKLDRIKVRILSSNAFIAWKFLERVFLAKRYINVLIDSIKILDSMWTSDEDILKFYAGYIVSGLSWINKDR